MRAGEWRKSSFCCGLPEHCVEVAGLPEGGVAVRDSAGLRGPVLEFTLAQWEAFTQGIKGGLPTPAR